MIEQIVETSKHRRTLLDDYVAAETQMRALYDGRALGRAVDAVLAQLPAGDVTLLATSPAGLGLAAATAASRREPTRWQPLNGTIGVEEAVVGQAVIVEPVDPGSGWRSMISRVVPGASFVFYAESVELVAA
jgi:hypothetical protein